MPKSIDITGKRFGRLVAIEPTNKRQGGSIVWKCKCDCGKQAEVLNQNLIKGFTKSCGCAISEDLTGKRFGRLVVVGFSGKLYDCTKEKLWNCKCDCGNDCIVNTRALKTGGTKSCGCIKEEFYNDKKHIEKGLITRGCHDGTMECMLTSKIIKSNTSGVRGVCQRKNGRYEAYITYKGYRYRLGLFWTLKEAKKARKIAEKKIWGKDLE